MSLFCCFETCELSLLIRGASGSRSKEAFCVCAQGLRAACRAALLGVPGWAIVSSIPQSHKVGMRAWPPLGFPVAAINDLASLGSAWWASPGKGVCVQGGPARPLPFPLSAAALLGSWFICAAAQVLGGRGDAALYSRFMLAAGGAVNTPRLGWFHAVT